VNILKEQRIEQQLLENPREESTVEGMGDFDFEELPEGESILVHLIAGATAGTAEHVGMFPIDTIKTNMQAARSTSATGQHTIVQTTQYIIQRKGVKGLFRGVSAVAAGAAPAHALHFATYEFCKSHLLKNVDAHSGHHPLQTGASGICATIVSDAVLTPMDAIKQKMQLGARHYKGMTDCVRTVIKTEGFGALYASYTTTLLMNVPYNAVYFASYESLRQVLKRGSEKEFDVTAHFIAGGGAGSIAAALTNPFDVAKTRLQTQGDTGKKYSGMSDALITMWKEEGKSGYLRGIRPRVILHSMSAAICWATYEWMKHFLHSMGVGSSK